jgi:hypothetical protein
VPIPKFKENMNFFLHSLTSKDSAYAAASAPVSIVLIAVGPLVTSRLDPKGTLNQEHHRKYNQAILEIGAEWKKKESPGGWKVEVLDLWEEMKRAAGGDEAGKIEKYRMVLI